MNIIQYLTTIHFGAGAVSSLSQTLGELGMTEPLVISDHRAKAAGLPDGETMQVLSSAPVLLDVPTNPTGSPLRKH